MPFSHEMIFDEHQQEIERVIDAELDRHKASGVARELAFEHIATRVYRAPTPIGENIKAGDLVIDVEQALLDGDERYPKGSAAYRNVYEPRDRAYTMIPGTPGEWLNGRPNPTPLANAVKLLLDPRGPEQELIRRRRIVREEQRAQAVKDHLEMLEINARRHANDIESKRMGAWHRLSIQERAAIRAGDKPLTGTAVIAERDNPAPPAGWMAEVPR